MAQWGEIYQVEYTDLAVNPELIDEFQLGLFERRRGTKKRQLIEAFTNEIILLVSNNNNAVVVSYGKELLHHTKNIDIIAMPRNIVISRY